MKQHRSARTIGSPRNLGRRCAGLATACVTTLAVLAGLAVTPTSASAATSDDPAYIGLFGSQDPTFDGVYRQSLSLIVLDAAHARVPEPAVKWLKRQQCDNGSYMSFRTDLNSACGPKDSNATALAVIAFKAVGAPKRANQAVNWLIDHQDRSGGWEYTAGWGPDSNSTGLVIQALIAMKIDPKTIKTRRSGPAFLKRLQLDCDSEEAASRGALDYMANDPLAPNDFATAQATAALAGATLPVGPSLLSDELPAFACPDGDQPTAAAAAAGYLGRVIDANSGFVPGFDGVSPDYGSTANAVMSLVAAGYGANQVTEATEVLENVAADYSRDDADKVVPAAAAALAFVAFATDGDPRAFGGTNPVRDILKSRTTKG
ncbi:MAG TPA: prenyltransferase/squalene oxidase repeat-containing protein [Actinomycetes bacterium]|nr:prenyltransferase/squalene oxidase repeat-containing protein [Actinomycetes bacterium]